MDYLEKMLVSESHGTNQDFYYGEDNNKCGPYAEWQIRYLMKNGNIKTNTIIFNGEKKLSFRQFVEKYGAQDNSVLLSSLIEEIKQISDDVEKVKWGVRGVGFVIVMSFIMIYFGGFRFWIK